MTKKNTKTDRVSLGPVIGPNARLAMRETDGNVEPIVVRRVLDGEPIHDGTEVAAIENPNCGCGHWQDVNPIYKREGRATESGPAQVATPEYRVGYDRIFGKRPTVGLA